MVGLKLALVALQGCCNHT